jgi:Fur family ferric uptake transcriptional regulator
MLREHGLRMTPQRQLILRLLDECSGHVAPEEIYQRVHAELPMVNRSTVYRTLEVLEDLGLIRHTHDGNGAERYHTGGYPNHLHLFCHVCGHLAEVDDLSVAEPLVDALHARYGFQADLSHFAIAGRCRHCAEQSAPAR